MINTFEEWFNQNERFSLNTDNDLTIDKKSIKNWLKDAFDAGYQSGEFNKMYLVQSLKSEIRTLNKEIAGLREERRLILDKDKPPGYNANLQ
jgi:hypothetical protein